MSNKPEFSVAEFIRKTKVTKPNGEKQVNDVLPGDIVLLARQPCEVDDVQEWWAGRPGSSDGVMRVTGFSLAQDIEVEETFEMWTDIPIFKGKPKKTEYVVLGLRGNVLQLSELNNTSLPMPFDITQDKNASDIRQRLDTGKRMIVRVKSFLGIRRIIDYYDLPETGSFATSN